MSATATVTATATATASQIGTWEIDASHSSVEFAVKHMMFSTVKGTFSDVSGTISLDEAEPSRSEVAVRIGAASVDTRDQGRDAHLRAADFFDVETYPEITFRSSRVDPVGDDRLAITGDLTIHGVTREVVLNAEFDGRGVTPFGKEVVGYTAGTKINRQDYGLTWNAALEAGGVLVSDTVKISLVIQAARQA